jgi:chemotaxis receptor (MCP) glutamine deamidase CheD
MPLNTIVPFGLASCACVCVRDATNVGAIDARSE